MWYELYSYVRAQEKSRQRMFHGQGLSRQYVIEQLLSDYEDRSLVRYFSILQNYKPDESPEDFRDYTFMTAYIINELVKNWNSLYYAISRAHDDNPFDFDDIGYSVQQWKIKKALEAYNLNKPKPKRKPPQKVS